MGRRRKLWKGGRGGGGQEEEEGNEKGRGNETLEKEAVRRKGRKGQSTDIQSLNEQRGMGASLTSLHKTPSPKDDFLLPQAKRARLEPDPCENTAGGFNNRWNQTGNFKTERLFTFLKPSPAWHASQEPLQQRWEGLPYVALVEIFRRLPNNDKINAALACRAWQLPFSRPALWRRANAQSRNGTVSTSIENLSIFLTSLLNHNNSQVSTFTLTHLRRFAKHLAKSGCDVIQLLTLFLASQKSLTLINLDHAGLGSDDAFQLLAAATDWCEASIHTVSITEAFCPVEGYDVASDNRLLELLARFTALAELSLSHRYLSDDLLYLLASTAAFTLIQISIWAGYIGRAEGRTTPRAWRHLALTCPNLVARCTVQGISHDQSFKDILTPGTPLKYFRMDCGGFTTMIDINVCINHITAHFCETLQHLELNFRFAFFDEVEDLVRLIERCTNLETLNITSDVATPQRQLRMERAVRRAFRRTPKSKLKVATFNEDKVILEDTWTTAVVDWLTSRQHGDLRLSGPPSGQGAGGGAQACDREIPVGLRTDSLSTVPPTHSSLGV
ncbi:F-box only protein 39 [Plakobranchus ocellatus]|uniref:F-box only protein 39 n=1 Tax=Plakobranchus ocellatus TaxID=259542 RepID=A0AAV3Y8C4_9GAST|nr:F-box only protein 39 [Plakobranchus ocellatus]